jgi:hypothetical protein
MMAVVQPIDLLASHATQGLFTHNKRCTHAKQTRTYTRTCHPLHAGSILLDADARALIIGRIFPRAALITPNKHETEVLVGYKLMSPQGRGTIDEYSNDKTLAIPSTTIMLIDARHNPLTHRHGTRRE